MPALLIQQAPQRSTQYANMIDTLAPAEIKLSPVGPLVQSMESTAIGRQPCLKCKLERDLQEGEIRELGLLSTGNGYFYYFDRLCEHQGPFLRPLETDFVPVFSSDLVTSRRYSGKTNELLTHFMCNLARYSSAYKDRAWSELRVFDPLTGGGTTLFTALMLGADAAGVEQNKKSIHGAAVFLRQYLQEQRISCVFKEERLKKINANRWRFEIELNQTMRCLLARGEIEQAPELIGGFKKPHFIIADLPYGIQHKGGLEALLEKALPVWETLMMPGGSLVFSWESTRFPRYRMVDLVTSVSRLTVQNEPPWTDLAHRVDRVIKNRDIITACSDAASQSGKEK